VDEVVAGVAVTCCRGVRETRRSEEWSVMLYQGMQRFSKRRQNAECKSLRGKGTREKSTCKIKQNEDEEGRIRKDKR